MKVFLNEYIAFSKFFAKPKNKLIIFKIKKMKAKFGVLLIILVISYSCKENKETANEKVEGKSEVVKETSHHEEKHWSYSGETGPEHWAEIEKNPNYNGHHQSPINIISVNSTYDATLKPLDMNYSANAKIENVTNNGHSIQYNCDKQDYFNLNGEKYNLHQIHFHESSEHTINGIRYPMEIHFVHLNKENKIAVLGVMVQEGISNPAFEFLEKYLPVAKDETKEINMPLDLNLCFPENKDYYSYSGSLTTPPCTEGVSWFVFKEPITISLQQVEDLKALMPLNNYRNEQKLYDRIVKKSFN